MALNDRFRANMKRRIQKAKDKQELFVKKLAIEMFSSVIMKSPVDTGRFRANWLVGISNPNLSTNKLTDESGEETINTASYQITNMKVNGQTIYLTNSLPYAYRLEYEGWSQQAPAGMVRLTVAEFNLIAQKIGAELRAIRI